LSHPAAGRTPGPLPTPCAFRGCPFLAFPDETSALVVLAYGGLVLLVCEDCAAALRRGRPPATTGFARAVGGVEIQVFNLANPEAST
jgi:hypothetical protein